MATRFIRNGANFTPQGANYISIPGGVVSTFDVGFYNGATIDAVFATMQAYKLNTVRLFLWPPSAGVVGTGLSAPYMANVADAIKRAYAHQIYTILSCPGLPNNYYTNFGFGAPYPGTPNGEQNWTYFDPNGVNARSTFLSDMMQSLIYTNGITQDMILAVELTGELNLDKGTYPLNQSGSVTTHWGTYTMPGAQATMAADAATGCLNAWTAEVKYVGGTSWQTMCQLSPETILDTSAVIEPYAAVFASNVDSIGLSLYPTYDRAMSAYVTALGGSLPTDKILTTLETGWLTAHSGTIYELADESVLWQQSACPYGIYGSSFFTWDCSHADAALLFGSYYNMIEVGGAFVLALNPVKLGDGCGTPNPLLSPILATSKVVCHFYSPGKYADNGDLPVHVSESLLSAKVIMEQTNQFDAHHLEFAEVESGFLMAIEPFTTVDIEQIGIGIIGRAIITAPSQQVDTTFVDKVVVDAPNITDQGLEVDTGVGYVDAQAIAQVVANLGSLGTKGISELVLDATTVRYNQYPYSGYFANGLANTRVTPGRPDGWGAVFVNDGSIINATAPVSWNIALAQCTPNGNTIIRNPNTGSGYFTHAPNWCGAVGSPAHVVTTSPCTFQWQIVVPTICQVGLSDVPRIGSPDWGFDFKDPGLYTTGANAGLYYGTWTVIYNGSGAGQPSGQFLGNTSFSVGLVEINGSPYVQYKINGLPIGSPAPLTYGNAFYPSVWMYSANAEVDNAIMSRNTTIDQAWYQVAYSKATKTEAIIKLAKDIGMFARLGADVNGEPQRYFELGPLNAPATVSLVDGSFGDIAKLRANKDIRVVDSIDSYKVDVSGVYTVSTPLGGGTDLAQVTIEFLWRIINDPTFQDFYGNYGYDLTKIFPEFDPNFNIYRYTTLSQGYEYFIVYEPAFAPGGFKAWLQGAALADGAFGYKSGGPSSDSTFVYPDQANVIMQEATQRYMYAAWVERMKRAVQPHVTLQLTTLGDWRPPRAGDKVRIDYTKIQTDKITQQPFAALRIHTGVDQLGNALPVGDPNSDPRLLQATRIFNGEEVPKDQYVLSNLGKYEDDDTTAGNSMETQVAALKLMQQNSLSVSHLNPSFSEIDTDHPVILPYYFVNTTYKVSAFYLYVSYEAFRQPVADANINNAAYFNQLGTHIYVTTLATDIPMPSSSDLNANGTTQGGGFSTDLYVHIYSASAGVNQIYYDAVPGAGNDFVFHTNTGKSGNIPVYRDTSANNAGITTSSSDHTHALTNVSVAPAGTTFLHMPKITQIAELPQHFHPIPPGITTLETPAGFTVQIDSGDGSLIERTGDLIDVLSGSGPSASGFSSGVLLEIGRFTNAPGKLVRIQLSTIGNGSDGGRGRIAWGGTIMETVGGIGSIVVATQ